MRAFYQSSLTSFKESNLEEIMGKISESSLFDDTYTQKGAWKEQIDILKSALPSAPDSEIFFEYIIPRIGKRIDNVIIHKGIIFLLEFKVGKSESTKQDLDQVEDYALDLKNFHEASHDRIIVPILIATKTKLQSSVLPSINHDNVYQPIDCIPTELSKLINKISSHHPSAPKLCGKEWGKSRYYPTPTIIEAAQTLYRGHGVESISRSDASIHNLSSTANAVNKVIDQCKKNNRKAICFITGVPGAGKTLAGLNIANNRQDYKEEELATFLSGNGPLVNVLREALARDEATREGTTLDNARRKVASFIQNIHHFRDDALKSSAPPAEKVIIFDEAQRAWNQEATSQFMQKKRDQKNFNQSEPHFLLSVMDRHESWAVIVCLIGEGQEINSGEAGISEWFNALNDFSSWEIYTPNHTLLEENKNIVKNITVNADLHLSVSIRAFRSEQLSNWVSTLLNFEQEKSQALYENLKQNYPIKITRSLTIARNWLLSKARGLERTGIVASSGAHRLKKEGIYVRREFQEIPWFLNTKDDVRSSYYLEEVATEFDIQGLELDWVCVAWDLDFRVGKLDWDYKNFRGSRWENVNQTDKQAFKKNAYRVLLTRARQGMVIYIPEGDPTDHTRQPQEYDDIYQYIKSLGIQDVKN